MTLPSDIPADIAERAEILCDQFRHIEDDREFVARILMELGQGGGQARYGLTGQQLETFEWVEAYSLAHGGVAPTVREVASQFSYSVSHAHAVITALVDRGFITRLPGRARSLALVQVHNVSAVHNISVEA